MPKKETQSLGQKNCRTKVPQFLELSSRVLHRILLRICPNFLSFLRISRAFFCWERTTENSSKKSPPFFNAKIPKQMRRKNSQFFWRAGKVTNRLGEAQRHEQLMTFTKALMGLCPKSNLQCVNRRGRFPNPFLGPGSLSSQCWR